MIDNDVKQVALLPLQMKSLATLSFPTGLYVQETVSVSKAQEEVLRKCTSAYRTLSKSHVMQ
jgi:hypothetical protein